MARWWRARRRAEALPEGWEDVVAERLAHWRWLDDDEQERLTGLMTRFYAEKLWEPARGFELTDEMRVTITAHACLLVLGLEYRSYRNVRSIIVHPTTMMLTGPRQGPVSGVVSDSPLPILGQAQQYQGPVVIAWDAALNDARHPDRGHNVMFHEFAHKLDMLDGVADGTPPLADTQALGRWSEVCTAEYSKLRAGRGGHLVRDYGAVNPAEFFAVVTEVFFERPVALRHEKSALYQVLSEFYRQDPAERQVTT